MRWVRLTYHFPYKPLSKSPQQSCPDYNAYASACDVLAKLPNLEELIIHLHFAHGLEANSAALLLDPLHQIRQLGIFSVHLYIWDPDQKVNWEIHGSISLSTTLWISSGKGVEIGACVDRDYYVGARFRIGFEN